MRLLLRSAARIETVHRAAYDEVFLTELYDLTRKLTDESWDSFRAHAATTALVHVFRDANTGAPVGFQFWRVAPIDLPRSRAILGGKLRVLPSHRGRGLHLRSALLFFLHCKARHPATRFYRLSVASLFGFVSISDPMAWFRFFDPDDVSAEGRALRAAFESFAADNGFRVEPSGLIHTGVGISDATLAQFGPGYFERESVRLYVRRNPEFRSNRCFVAFWFRFDARNLASLLRTIWQKR